MAKCSVWCLNVDAKYSVWCLNVDVQKD